MEDTCTGNKWNTEKKKKADPQNIYRYHCLERVHPRKKKKIKIPQDGKNNFWLADPKIDEFIQSYLKSVIGKKKKKVYLKKRKEKRYTLCLNRIYVLEPFPSYKHTWIFVYENKCCQA